MFGKAHLKKKTIFGPPSQVADPPPPPPTWDTLNILFLKPLILFQITHNRFHTKVIIIELFCNGHFVLEFGQFVSVTWLNLLRRLGFGQTPPPPPVGTPAQICFFFLNEPSLTELQLMLAH